MTPRDEDRWMFWNGKPIHFPEAEGVEPIYLIGDSHVRVLGECFPDVFRTSGADIADVFTDSKTAYIAGSVGHDLYLKECLRNIPEGSKVLLSFGEIDCRHYLPRLAIERGASLKSLVGEVMDRYTTNCVRVLMERFRVMILGPYVCPDDHNHANPYAEIVRAKSLLNSRLEFYCYQNGILFVPAFREALMARWDEMPEGTYFNDSSHLGPCMIPVILSAMDGFQWGFRGELRRTIAMVIYNNTHFNEEESNPMTRSYEIADAILGKIP